MFYHSPVFRATMSRNRYQIITKFLHFADNKNWKPTDPNRDRLYKIRPLLEYLVGKFQSVYTPSKVIAIDEQLLLHKGNLHFKMYMPLKRSRFGIKFFSLCDKTGYLWNTELYVGKNHDETDTVEETHGPIGKSGQVVMRLIRPLLGKGHELYIDNWFVFYYAILIFTEFLYYTTSYFNLYFVGTQA